MADTQKVFTQSLELFKRDPTYLFQTYRRVLYDFFDEHEIFKFKEVSKKFNDLIDKYIYESKHLFYPITRYRNIGPKLIKSYDDRTRFGAKWPRYVHRCRIRIDFEKWLKDRPYVQKVFFNCMRDLNAFLKDCNSKQWPFYQNCELIGNLFKECDFFNFVPVEDSKSDAAVVDSKSAEAVVDAKAADAASGSGPEQKGGDFHLFKVAVDCSEMKMDAWKDEDLDRIQSLFAPVKAMFLRHVTNANVAHLSKFVMAKASPAFLGVLQTPEDLKLDDSLLKTSVRVLGVVTRDHTKLHLAVTPERCELKQITLYVYDNVLLAGLLTHYQPFFELPSLRTVFIQFLTQPNEPSDDDDKNAGDVLTKLLTKRPQLEVTIYRKGIEKVKASTDVAERAHMIPDRKQFVLAEIDARVGVFFESDESGPTKLHLYNMVYNNSYNKVK